MYNSRTLIQLELRPGHKVEGTTCLSFWETGGLGTSAKKRENVGIFPKWGTPPSPLFGNDMFFFVFFLNMVYFEF